MGIIEDVKKMQQEGRSEQETVNALQSQGHGTAEIYDGIAQARIKDAVTASPPEQTLGAEPRYASEGSMQPSLLGQQTVQEVHEEPPAQPSAAYDAYPQQYQDYSYAAPSADAVTEIVEQIVAEKLANLKQTMEKVIDLRTAIDTRLEYLDERLKRIEKIIDRLQLSVLQKVGEYMTNVEDIKTELQETQKSFKSLLPESKRPAHKQEEKTE